MTESQTIAEPRIRKTWVAFGENGAIASIHAIDEGYAVRFLGRDDYHGTYGSIEVAKRAVAAQRPGEVTFEEH
jgi:hypothetical protein